METTPETAAAAGIVGLIVTAAFGIIGIISLVCWIKVLIALFKKEGVGLGILGIICGIFAFIWGWVKNKETGLKTTMVWWTICLVASIVLWLVAAASLVGMAANSPEFQKALEDAKKAAEQQAGQALPQEQ